MKLKFLLALLVALPLQCMELSLSSQILSQPDMIKLIAYALVDIMQQGRLIGHSSYNNREADKQLLATLRNFSATNKIIHDTVYNLRCGSDKEAARFNCHFYTRMGGRLTTAAFMGTPWALNIVLGERFKQLETKNGKIAAIKELNILLGARAESTPQYIQPDMPPSYHGTLPPVIIGYDSCYESITKTIAKFPPSTRQFIIKLIK